MAGLIFVPHSRPAEVSLNILIVYAHFEQKSFNGTMLRTALDTLARLGHDIRISDLYAERFDPVPDPRQFSHRADPDHFELMAEQAHANAKGVAPPDLSREQERIRWADAIILQFPFWWWSLPAILKGWVDRVLSNGFAYGSADLTGKSAMLSLTAETKAGRFANDAEYPILEHIEGGVLRFCGLKVLPRFVVPEVLSLSNEERGAALIRFQEHLREQFGDSEANLG